MIIAPEVTPPAIAHLDAQPFQRPADGAIWIPEETDLPADAFYPVISELRDCRQVTRGTWEGIDLANGEVVRFAGKPKQVMPRYALACPGGIPWGWIRIVPAAEPRRRRCYGPATPQN